MKVLENIKRISNENKISLARIERECELSSGSINKWNKSSPSVVNIKKVADYLNVTVDDLLK